ncbi:MAG TPA: alanine--tRNA ligase [Kofleriaceae bacterium]|nr:alanine--tRNA ligase [Kofleriaceae bacterium]
MKTDLTSTEIREIFQQFFEQKDHLRIAAAPLVPKNDPTILYTVAGMAPLKPYFVGEKKPPRPDLVNVQPCIRTKDIDDVGDRHHLTLFEMLGSWSIGHYFKERAVELAYELLIDRFGFPPERLYVSVYAGNPDIDLPADERTARAWEKVGIPRDRIVFLGEDNFWGPAGDVGPCGPCTEVFFDTGEAYGPAYVPGGELDTKGRYIEIWNAGVFMELNKLADGSFAKLPFSSVDTGSGLERMALILGGFDNVYETDLLAPLVAAIGSGLGKDSSLRDRRVIADHIRAATFILAEDVVPGNEGRAYIPRRLIRKCVAISTRAGARDLDYPGLLGLVVDKLSPAYPHLAEKQASLTAAFVREKEDFERVIGRGLDRLESLCGKPGFVVSGEDAFSLFATYGLPVDIVRDVVAERGGSVDDAGFDSELARHQEVSRAPKAQDATSTWATAAAFSAVGDLSTEFVGYEHTETEARILAVIKDGRAAADAGAGDTVEVICDRTPFYAEGGGQIGDKGRLIAGDAEVAIDDTVKVGGFHVHRGHVVRGSIAPGQTCELVVDDSRRRLIMANHSATHILHAALRQVLGTHVRQAGSLVEVDRLRFDFEHPSRVAPEQLAEIERLVNAEIQRNHVRETVVTTYDDAVSRGALAFFGENYGDEVRMVRFGGFSTELCGGTHVHATGDIGAFRIASEQSVASGVRRIVALTGPAAVAYTLEQDALIRELSTKLKTSPTELSARVTALMDRPKAKAKAAAVKADVDVASEARKSATGISYVAVRMDGGAPELRAEALRLADKLGGVACLVGEDQGVVRMVVAVAKAVTGNIKAPAVLRDLLPLVGGKGGGQPHLAQGGGPDLAGIAAALERVPAAVDSASA